MKICTLYNLKYLHLYYNVKSKLFLLLINLIILRHINCFHNFTPHYFNIYILIEFKFYSIIKHLIKILTHYMSLIEIIYCSIYINTIIMNV